MLRTADRPSKPPAARELLISGSTPILPPPVYPPGRCLAVLKIGEFSLHLLNVTAY